MSRYIVEAIVLKANNYRDSDKIYTLFSRERGKFFASARGVRKISSKRGGNLDTLNHIKVTISEGKNKKYKTITEVKTLNSFMDLKSSLDNSIKGFYMAELIYKLLEEGQVHSDVFVLLIKSLLKLNGHLNNEVSRVNAFEIALMQYLGYEMYLDKCAKTGIPYDDSWEIIKFNPNFGGFVSDPTLPGLILEKSTADLLCALKSKPTINKSLLENKKSVNEADKIVKTFVRDILEDNTRTARVFGGI